MSQPNSTQGNTSNNTIQCPRNATTVSQIRSILESGDIVDCSGCNQFVYRNGICGCNHLNH